MKKSKLSLCLASSFVAALSLVACSGDVTSKEDAVVTITDANGNVVDILTDAAYNKYKSDSNGVSKFYNAILETLIRYEYANPASKIRTQNWTKAIKSNEDIKAEAENNVKNDKNTAEENAKTNDTSYETEWEAILSSHNCEDEAELLEYYIYQLEKEDMTDKFFLEQKDSTLLTEWIGVKDDGSDPQGTAKGVFPYHIRHVLTSISGGNTDFYNGTITTDEAKNLGNTMSALVSTKYTFADVAKSYSGDSGSGEKGGDVGIMTTTTAFVNEFKLGIYVYDAIYNTANADKAALGLIREGVGLTNDYTLDVYGNSGILNAWKESTGVNAGKVEKVPYGAFKVIGDLAEAEKDQYGKQVNKGNEHYFPRNVLYNYYLNFHNPFVITNRRLDDQGFVGAVDTSLSADRFQATIDGDKVLTDEKGNVVIGVRSEHGIHFMIMEKSIFDYQQGGNGSDNTSLEDYYTSLTPSDSNYPYKADHSKKDTYVSYIKTTENSTYTTRAGEVKTAVQSFDSTYDYRLYKYILAIEGDNIVFNDNDLAKNIDAYISRTRESNNDNAYKTLHESWRTYTELVALQYASRTGWAYGHAADVDITDDIRTISPRCAIGFKDHASNDWLEHGGAADDRKGVCYYED